MVSEEAVGVVARGSEDDVLVAAAIRDRSQFAVLYERYRLPVYRYLRARGADDDLAVDLTADTLEKALRSLHRFRVRGGGFVAWLFRIARNAHIDDRRRSSRFTTLSRGTPEPYDEQDFDTAIDVRRLLSHLSPSTRDAIALRYGAGLTAREIGSIIGKRPEAVQKLIERGLDTLKEELR